MSDHCVCSEEIGLIICDYTMFPHCLEIQKKMAMGETTENLGCCHYIIIGITRLGLVGFLRVRLSARGWYTIYWAVAVATAVTHSKHITNERYDFAVKWHSNFPIARGEPLEYMPVDAICFAIKEEVYKFELYVQTTLLWGRGHMFISLDLGVEVRSKASEIDWSARFRFCEGVLLKLIST